MGREGGRLLPAAGAPRLPAHLASPRYLGGAGMWPPAPSATAPLPSRSPPDSRVGLGSVGLTPPAPTSLGEQPPANFRPGEEERLGLLWGAGNLARRLIRQANCSQLGAAHPAPHPPSLAQTTPRSLGAKKGAKPATTCRHLPATLYLLPVLKMPQQVL